MFPFLRPGDKLVVRRGPSLKLRTGNIVLYRKTHSQSIPSLMAHRIVRKISEEHFITKGDNLESTDPGICRLDEVIGQVIFVIRKARLVSLDTGPYAWLQGPIALFSRINCTPGIVARRFKNFVSL